jgi:hypothetical protein
VTGGRACSRSGRHPCCDVLAAGRSVIQRSRGRRVGDVCTGRAVGELRQALQTMTDALEVGHWRAILHPQAACAVGQVAGPEQLVLWGVVLRMIARSMQLQAQGHVQEAWDQLGKAAHLLPRGMRSPTPPGGVARAVRRPRRRDASVDEELAWRITRLVWREQFELSDLRDRFYCDLPSARAELVEACIEYLCWVEFDPFVFSRPGPGASTWDDGVSVDRERSRLCLRGTRLRQFASPRKRALSKSVWIDIGAYRGLCAEALGRLADRPEPAPWCGTTDTSDLKVRLGLRRAWEHARQWREDVDHWR